MTYLIAYALFAAASLVVFYFSTDKFGKDTSYPKVAFFSIFWPLTLVYLIATLVVWFFDTVDSKL